MLPIQNEVCHDVIKPNATKIETNSNTQNLLNEFEIMLNAVEFNNGTLTPPQTPPYEQPVFTTLEPIQSQPIYAIPAKQYAYTKREMAPQNFMAAYTNEDQLNKVYNVENQQSDLAHELAVVEELIKTRAENMVQVSSPPSPSNNSSSSCSSFGDYMSDDPEWIPDTLGKSPTLESSTKYNNKHGKPYNRPTEDKKSRKKEQNKNAATRYRLKKKAEVEEVISKEGILKQHNTELRDKITEVQRETKYLKMLMFDLFKAKGLIN